MNKNRTKKRASGGKNWLDIVGPNKELLSPESPKLRNLRNVTYVAYVPLYAAA